MAILNWHGRPGWSAMTSKQRRWIIAIAAVVGMGVVVSIILQIQQSRQRARSVQSDGLVPVIAASTKLADVPVYLEGIGTTRALNTVTVRPQADGKLVSVLFREGQDVRRGDVLARIDPTTYQAQYDQVVAKKAQDEATLANAKIDLERYTHLSTTNSIARQQLDTQRATVAQLEALVKLDQAVIDNARAILDYTTITAPIDGRIGIRLVDEGNIVRASDATGIVIITQIRPMSIIFTIPQQQIARVNAVFAKGALAVEALGADNKSMTDRGTLLVVDNQVDQATGTVKLKAEFPNSDVQLWPGQFVNVRLLIDTLRQVVVVPTAAVQRGPSGTFVYVVQADSAVEVRPVTVSQQDETQAVITRGLQAAERVVTTGFARLATGTRVTVTSAEDAPAATPPTGPRRDGRPGREGGPRGGRSNAPAGAPP